MSSRPGDLKVRPSRLGVYIACVFIAFTLATEPHVGVALADHSALSQSRNEADQPATADAPGPGSVAVFQFDPHTQSLHVTTSAMALTIQGGAVTRLKDVRTGEVFSSGATPDDLAKASAGVVWGLEPARARGAAKPPETVSRRPQASSPVAFHQPDHRTGVLIYTGLSNGPVEDQLRLHLRSEDRGDLLFRLEMRCQDPATLAREVLCPLIGLRTAGVILGSGERFARADPECVGRAMRVANNIYSPPVGVIEGHQSVIGIWPDPGRCGYDDLVVRHTPEQDEVIPQVCLPFGARDPETAGEPGVTRSSWWRMAALPTWLDVAKRYRADLEAKSGARPLWLQSPEWVRQIHAVCKERPRTTDPTAAAKFYADLASRFDPQKLLLFYWNGDCILLFGDHRYMTRLGYPTPQEIDALRQRGFRWLGYHPYVLLFSPRGKDAHLADAQRRGFGVPDGYVFQPDYAGPPEIEKFYDDFRPVAAGYYAPLETSDQLWVLHPGAQRVREYLARNLGNYCRAHEMSGCYLDIMGADGSMHFIDGAPDDRRILEGHDWRHGEERACREMKQANPDLALMSEVQGEWTTIHTFYTWEGQTHLTHPEPVRLNHPLRAACWGSYTWTQTDSPEALALMAGLPAIELTDDWSIARARLYMDQELFHDLPERWDEEALAYLRGKDDRWFQYRKMPWGFGYVELTSGGPKTRMGRLLHPAQAPLSEPIRIQRWLGYRDGRPIGLNPASEYNFMVEEPLAENQFWITDLPPAAYLTAIRHASKHSVIEFGTAAAPGPGRVRATFHRDCRGVKDADRDYAGPFAAGTTADFDTRLPGGLVFLWSEPEPADGRFTANFLGDHGHLQANGLAYDQWTPNSTVRSATVALDNHAPPAPLLELETGLHRAWVDQWVDLAPASSTVLHFDVGYPSAEQPREMPVALSWSLRVNGSEVWREEVAPEVGWRPRQVPLAQFAGRRVLVTLSAEEPLRSDSRSRAPILPARFANLRIVNNPRPEIQLDAAGLPPPRRVLFEDLFRGPELSAGWTARLSPAHGADGRMVARDGRLMITGQHYKYQYLARSFPPEADCVQSLVEVPPTGCMTRWNPGLALWWKSNQWLFVSLGDDGVVAELGNREHQQIPIKSTDLPVYQERYFAWIRLRLTANQLLVDISLDGKTWEQKCAFARDASIVDPPQQLLLGRGTGGQGELFDNDERWETAPSTSRLGQVQIGSDVP